MKDRETKTPEYMSSIYYFAFNNAWNGSYKEDKDLFLMIENLSEVALRKLKEETAESHSMSVEEIK